MNRRRNCPWCAKSPVFVSWETGCEMRCLNDACKVQPASKVYIYKHEAEHAWNNPIVKKERFYSESELKEIFEMLFVEDEIQDYFFKK